MADGSTRIDDGLKGASIGSAVNAGAAGVDGPKVERGVDGKVCDVTEKTTFVEETKVVNASSVALQVSGKKRLFEIVGEPFLDGNTIQGGEISLFVGEDMPIRLSCDEVKNVPERLVASSTG